MFSSVTHSSPNFWNLSTNIALDFVLLFDTKKTFLPFFPTRRHHSSMESGQQEQTKEGYHSGIVTHFCVQEVQVLERSRDDGRPSPDDTFFFFFFSSQTLASFSLETLRIWRLETPNIPSQSNTKQSFSSRTLRASCCAAILNSIKQKSEEKKNFSSFFFSFLSFSRSQDGRPQPQPRRLRRPDPSETW